MPKKSKLTTYTFRNVQGVEVEVEALDEAAARHTAMLKLHGDRASPGFDPKTCRGTGLTLVSTQ